MMVMRCPRCGQFYSDQNPKGHVVCQMLDDKENQHD